MKLMCVCAVLSFIFHSTAFLFVVVAHCSSSIPLVLYKYGNTLLLAHLPFDSFCFTKVSLRMRDKPRMNERIRMNERTWKWVYEWENALMCRFMNEYTSLGTCLLGCRRMLREWNESYGDECNIVIDLESMRAMSRGATSVVRTPPGKCNVGAMIILVSYRLLSCHCWCYLFKRDSSMRFSVCHWEMTNSFLP